jgi:uncharacterized Zn-finger protein
MPSLRPTVTIDPPEVIKTGNKRVKCNGGGALGHPLVFYDMGEADFVECLYCDRRFVYDPAMDDADHH